MGRELKPPSLPARDGVPIEVPETAPGVGDVPGVVTTDEIGHEERHRGEPQFGEDRVRTLRQRGVAVIEGEQEGRLTANGRSVRAESLDELAEGEGRPPRSRERGHLTLEDGLGHARDTQLERPANAVVAQHGRTRPRTLRHCASAPPPPAPPPPPPPAPPPPVRTRPRHRAPAGAPPAPRPARTPPLPR